MGILARPRHAPQEPAKRMVARVHEDLAISPRKLIGDTGYGSAEMLAWLVHERDREQRLGAFATDARVSASGSLANPRGGHGVPCGSYGPSMESRSDEMLLDLGDDSAAMLPSELDGFPAGVIIGPDLIEPFAGHDSCSISPSGGSSAPACAVLPG